MVNENKATNEKQEREHLKSLSCGIVTDLSRLLADQGFGGRAIDIVEALVFGMFVVADTFSLAQPDKEQAIEVIHNFYDDMRDYFINQVIIKDYQVAEAQEIEAVAAKFHDLSRVRFSAYGEKFQQDLTDPMAGSCPTTVNYLLDNLFIEPINQAEKLELLGAVSDKVLYYWAGCVQSFKG